MKITGGLRYKPCALCGEMHEVANWPDNHVQPIVAPMVIRDGLPDLRHPSDNRYYDSKRAFRKTTAEFGGLEVGTDENKDHRWVDPVKSDEVAVAKQMVDQGYKPRPETATGDDMKSVIA